MFSEPKGLLEADADTAFFNPTWSLSRTASRATTSTQNDDLVLSRQFGIQNEFIRQFGPLSTFSFAMSIISVSSCVASTLDQALLTGGPSSVVYCWLGGSIFSMSMAVSISELISAYPTCGGLYAASAWLVPERYRAVTGWVVGWLNGLGQLACTASTEFGLAKMIWAGVIAATDGHIGAEASHFAVFALFAGLLIVHGLTNSLRTHHLAGITRSLVFVNLGITGLIILLLLFLTPPGQMQSPRRVFAEVQNQSQLPDSMAFLLSLLPVQWTLTNYDAVAHISFEIQRPALMAPAALCVAVSVTGLLRLLLNVTLMLAAPDVSELPGITNNSFLEILLRRMGKPAALLCWFTVCAMAAGCVQTVMHANARSFFAFASDKALPSVFARMSPTTKTPLNAVWLVVAGSMLLGSLHWASSSSLEAVFSMCAVALDLSYVVPVACRLIFQNHPEVLYKPGPFYTGKRWSPIIGSSMCVWTVFECTVLSMPTRRPLTAATFNWSWVITLGILAVSLLYFWAYGHKTYHGPVRTEQSPALGFAQSFPVYAAGRPSPRMSFSTVSTDLQPRHRFPSRDSVALVVALEPTHTALSVIDDVLSDASDSTALGTERSSGEVPADGRSAGGGGDDEHEMAEVRRSVD